jgi:hypothetical protein
LLVRGGGQVRHEPGVRCAGPRVTAPHGAPRQGEALRARRTRIFPSPSRSLTLSRSLLTSLCVPPPLSCDSARARSWRCTTTLSSQRTSCSSTCSWSSRPRTTCT